MGENMAGEAGGLGMSRAQRDPGYMPPQVDVTRPNMARVYDAILGGKDNFAADREIADLARQAFPDGGRAAHIHRELLGRAVRYMAGRGVAQFLDLGAGLPTVQNTHEIAQSVSPGARVVYVDNDPVVLSHGRALLADNVFTAVVLADLREPGEVWAMPEIGGFLDLSQPAGLILNGVIHHMSDDEDPYGIIGRYKELLARAATCCSRISPAPARRPGRLSRCCCAQSAAAGCAAARRSPGSSTAWTSSSRASATCRSGILTAPLTPPPASAPGSTSAGSAGRHSKASVVTLGPLGGY
jgi:S-adenosyl methyltransferase